MEQQVVVDSWERWVRLVRRLAAKLGEEAPPTGHKDRVAWLDACFALGELVAVLGTADRVHALAYLDKCRVAIASVGRLHLWRPLEQRAEELLRLGVEWPEGVNLAPQAQAPQAQAPQAQEAVVEVAVVVGGEGVEAVVEEAVKKTSRKLTGRQK